ncbi:hypothetical protein [Saccharopolyspora griseoalba]|uniref:Uncharacterized protein n=1 Tax=Saccharopolyspora griseoalba TaxID=1431848 RepID=A0ABW2LPY4_9PSEU
MSVTVTKQAGVETCFDHDVQDEARLHAYHITRTCHGAHDALSDAVDDLDDLRKSYALDELQTIYGHSRGESVAREIDRAVELLRDTLHKLRDEEGTV